MNNYKQALKILKGEEALQELMKTHNIGSMDVFRMWLDEEREYLSTLSKEPPEETHVMDYWVKLQELDEAKYV